MTAETTFDATQDTLEGLLKEIGTGKLQLPDFQRGWVWDDRHIQSLITSVSRAFPVGAVMLLQTGGDIRFQPRLVEGVTLRDPPSPDRLILDGQQRLTSLFQALTLKHSIRTKDDKGKEVDRWYYVDMQKALGTSDERELAVFSIRPDKRFTKNFDRDVLLDLSSQELEFKNHMFPVHKIFDSDAWSEGWMEHWKYDPEKIKFFNRFRSDYIQTFKTYQIPIIQLRKSASKEAVCLVFEKVNTGGVALTAFELLTATYAADGFNLREDWLGKPGAFPGRAAEMSTSQPLLSAVESTDFLQAISLLHTYTERNAARDAGRPDHELPAISCTRQSILALPLRAYQAHAATAQEGFLRAAQFLWREKIFTAADLPYRTQLVPLATVLASLGNRWQDDNVREFVRRWYWCGVFGELYGSAIESRFAKDLHEVVLRATGSTAEPSTVADCNFATDRLLTMRSRLSAAYKGLSALVMQEGGGAFDWRTGATVEEQLKFGEQIDIHHIFPRAWCNKAGIKPGVYNSIVNKTPLSKRTNIQIGGDAPSVYTTRLQQRQKMQNKRLDELLATHYIDPSKLRADDFIGMITARAAALVQCIEAATGRPAGGRSPFEVFGEPLAEDLAEDPSESLAA